MVEETDPTKPNEENPNPIKSKDLQYVFQPGRDHFPAKPYYEDGDPTMYTSENMDARDELRDNPRVREQIHEFVTKQFVLQGNSKMCTKDEYCRVFMKVGQILRPGIDTDELARLIREDFENDTQPRKRRKRQTGDDDDEPVQQEPEEQEAEVPVNKDALTEE